MSEWVMEWMEWMDTPQTVMTTRAPAVLKNKEITQRLQSGSKNAHDGLTFLG